MLFLSDYVGLAQLYVPINTWQPFGAIMRAIVKRQLESLWFLETVALVPIPPKWLGWHSKVKQFQGDF